MLPSELKLTCLGHCFVHLPETFVSKSPAVKGGAVVSIRSIQSDSELLVMWNGQLTSGEHVDLDISFGQANNLKDELVIINSIENPDLGECSSCRVELMDSSDYSILNQHTETNLLDTCKLISRDLVIPMFMTQHVKVMVKVAGYEPSDKPIALLTKWTELTFVHSLAKLPKAETEVDLSGESKVDITTSIPFLTCALGVSYYKPKFHFGSMLVCGDRGSGKTYRLKEILNENRSFHGEYLNFKQLRGKRPENISKTLTELLTRAQSVTAQPASLIALDDIDSLLSPETKHEEEQGQDVLYNKRLVALFCNFQKQIEQINSKNNRTSKIVAIASCRSLESLDKRLSQPEGRRYFSEIIHIFEPDLETRVIILENLISKHQQVGCTLGDEKRLVEVARKCKSFMPSDLVRLYERAIIVACSRSNLEFSSEPVSIQLEDFLEAIDDYTPFNLRSVSLQPKSSLRTFEQIGGMKEVKEALLKTILLPLKYPILYGKFPLKSQNSILLYGPPGCGKTLIAEAISNSEGLNSICVRGPELLSKYIGASEAAVRDVFKRAQLARPCVLFFDEFESLVAKRGADSTGVTDRIVNQFLTILDGFEHLAHDVFIVAASSRPDMIDPAMLRPGRLDKHIYCPLPDEQDRLEILKVLTRTIDLADDVCPKVWARELDKFTGADINSLLCSAQLKALNEIIRQENPGPKADLVIRIERRHMEQSFDEMRRDVLLNYRRLLKAHPPEINRINRQQMSVRASLA